MRQLKFRAWERDKKEMFDPLIGYDVGVNFSTHKGGYYSPLMQYTGFNDKKGKEIYEGDICLVIHHEDIGDDSYYNEFLMQVRWDLEQGAWLLVGDDIDYSLGRILQLAESEWSYSVEVIGNTYQTPELLKGESQSEESI